MVVIAASRPRGGGVNGYKSNMAAEASEERAPEQPVWTPSREQLQESEMARFSSSMNLDSRRRNRQLTLDFLAAASGGPTLYLGKDMKPSHAGLGISASEWKIAMNHIERALVKFKVPERESKELLAIVDGLRGEIVER